MKSSRITYIARDTTPSTPSLTVSDSELEDAPKAVLRSLSAERYSNSGRAVSASARVPTPCDAAPAETASSSSRSESESSEPLI